MDLLSYRVSYLEGSVINRFVFVFQLGGDQIQHFVQEALNTRHLFNILFMCTET